MLPGGTMNAEKPKTKRNNGENEKKRKVPMLYLCAMLRGQKSAYAPMLRGQKSPRDPPSYDFTKDTLSGCRPWAC